MLDLGCGAGALLERLLKDGYTRARRRGRLGPRARRSPSADCKLADAVSELLHGSLMYRDARLAGFDCGREVEVIEHLDPPRLFERSVLQLPPPPDTRSC